jgi:ATP synthase protein I
MRDRGVKRPKVKKWVDLISKYGTIGLEMGLCVAIGVIFGAYLDKFLHTSPWLTLVFTIFGFIAGFKSLFKLARDLIKDEEEKNRDGGAGKT